MDRWPREQLEPSDSVIGGRGYVVFIDRCQGPAPRYRVYLRTGRRVVVRVRLALETGRLALLSSRHLDRIVKSLRGPVINVRNATGPLTVGQRRERASDLFANNAEHHHVRAWYEHSDHDHGCGTGQADHDAHVWPLPGQQHVSGAPAQPDDRYQVCGDGEARALPVVALRSEHKRRRDAQEHQQQRIVRQAAQEHVAVDKYPTQVRWWHDDVYG